MIGQDGSFRRSSLLRRLRVIAAALRQDWYEFTCPGCGNQSLICGHAPDLAGLLCVECEGKQFDAWMNDFTQRHEREKGAA